MFSPGFYRWRLSKSLRSWDKLQFFENYLALEKVV